MSYAIPDDTRLKGVFTPMRFEATVEDCIVTEGEIPADIAGGFYRSGPSWRRPSQDGRCGMINIDGMVQGLVLENGRAQFRNRWIRTPKYVLEEQLGRGLFALTDGFDDWRNWGWGDVVERNQYNYATPQGTNWVNIFPFAGDMVASSEQGGPPIAIDPITLETKGIVSWSPKLSPGIHEPVCYGDNAFTAHPKWDHDTGVLYGWTHRDVEPYVTVHIVHPDGAVDSRELWDAPYNTFAHDIWLTPEWMVMPFQPFLIDKSRIAKQELNVFAWNPDLPIVFALIPRHDMSAPVRYIQTDLEPQYMMHTMSANVSGESVTLDGPIFNRPPLPLEQDFAPGDEVALFFSISAARLGRLTIDLATGGCTHTQLSDRPSELPKVDERFYGKGYRWACQIGGESKRGGMSMNSLVVTDMQTLAEESYQIRSGTPAGVMEATFVPRHKGSPEGDGYVIVPVSWWAENRGEYLIFDTDDITTGPICRIELPFRLGWTGHGHWMDFR